MYFYMPTTVRTYVADLVNIYLEENHGIILINKLCSLFCGRFG